MYAGLGLPRDPEMTKQKLMFISGLAGFVDGAPLRIVQNGRVKPFQVSLVGDADRLAAS